MIKSELISRIAARHPGLDRRDIERVISAILASIGQSLSSGKRVELRGFGTFNVKVRGSHPSRNPKTGEKIIVAEKKVLHFRASKELLRRMNEPVTKTSEQITAGQGVSTAANS
jgi:integration host factor subunit beta